jgi:protease IV
MKEFLKMMLASMAGFFLASVLFSFLTLIMLVAVISLAPREDIRISSASVLHVRLDMPLQDRGTKSPFDAFGGMGSSRSMGLNQILRGLENAADDDRIQGVFLEMGVIQGGMATLEELRNGLIRFAESGKPIVAYGEMVSQRSYYLATPADRVFLNPRGMLDFSGLSAQVAFIKGLNEKLKVEMQVIRPGNNTYKSTVEPLLLDRMSEANKEQTAKYLQSNWEQLLLGIAMTRGITEERLNTIADSLSSFRTELALEYGLVDGLLYYDEVMDSMKQIMGLPSGQDPELVSIRKYIRHMEKSGMPDSDGGKKSDRIAVVYASGNIVSGRGEETVISSGHMSSAIRNAREDDKVKAIVLRINSPGGDGLASEIIWREVALAARTKPVVVSMGDFAASGGYYIAAPATKIVAQPNTLTGSIGVFGVVPNLQNLFKDHLGITFDEVKTNQNSGLGNVMRPLNPFEHRLLQRFVDDFYDHFLQRVAEGRGMTKEAVDSIGQGRVWSGRDALAIGLVDALGGLEEAIQLAASEAGLVEYHLVELPEQTDPFVKLFRQLSGETRANTLIRKQLGEHFRLYEMVLEMGAMQGVQARLPFDITIR